MGITHLSGLEVAGVPTMGMGGWPPFTGKWYFVDPAHGSDGNEGTADSPLATLYRAYALARSGYNDVIVLVGDGSTTGTARMSVALAQTVDPTATTGTITWAKNALHLLGMTAPTGIFQRARIAPPTGTYTAATFGNNGNMFNVTASGCMFANFSVYGGFSTGSTTCMTWKDSGSRNYYGGVHIAGLADAASAGAAGARTLYLQGAQESVFERCTLGTDTVTRSAANATVEFDANGSTACARIKFLECDFPFMASAASPLGMVAGASDLDRWIVFDRCRFLNASSSTSTTLTDLSTVNAAAGGYVLFNECIRVGITGLGSDLTNLYVGGTTTVNNAGLALQPAA